MRARCSSAGDRPPRCRAGSVASVGQDRLILHYGDQAIASYRGCGAGSPDPARLSVGQDRLILTCSAGARGFFPRAFFFALSL